MGIVNIRKDIEVPICCKKMMHEEETDNMISDEYSISFVCLECGSYINLVEGQLDEEELDNYKDNCGFGDEEEE